MMTETKETTESDGIKVINTLSELIYPQQEHETNPKLEATSSVTETAITENFVDDEDRTEITSDNDSYIDSIDESPEHDPDFSDPIDIVTEHDDDDQYHEAAEENEIPDETDDLETEFIQHETEPLLQDITNQMMHYIEESSTAKQEDVEATTTRASDETEGQATGGEKSQELNDGATQTEATQVTEVIDINVSETSHAENMEMSSNKNGQLQELTTGAVEAIITPTEKPVEIESSSTMQGFDAIKVHSEEASSAASLVLESTTVTEEIVDATTEAILDLTSRTAVMEPNAELSSTIANFIHDRSGDEVTTVSTISSEATTKDTRRKYGASFSSK